MLQAFHRPSGRDLQRRSAMAWRMFDFFDEYDPADVEPAPPSSEPEVTEDAADPE